MQVRDSTPDNTRWWLRWGRGQRQRKTKRRGDAANYAKCSAAARASVGAHGNQWRNPLTRENESSKTAGFESRWGHAQRLRPLAFAGSRFLRPRLPKRDGITFGQFSHRACRSADFEGVASNSRVCPNIGSLLAHWARLWRHQCQNISPPQQCGLTLRSTGEPTAGRATAGGKL